MNSAVIIFSEIIVVVLLGLIVFLVQQPSYLYKISSHPSAKSVAIGGIGLVVLVLLGVIVHEAYGQNSGSQPSSYSANISNPATNMVYTETNDPNPDHNAVLAFHRDPNTGALTKLGSFLTGGTGVSSPQYVDGPLDEDQPVITNTDHTLLFAVNGGSNTIAIFHINSDGSLKAVPGSPFPSLGYEPASLGISKTASGTRLYVTNKNQDPGQDTNPDISTYPFDSPTGANRVGFTLNADGSLTPIAGAVVTDPPAASASQALVARGGNVLIDAEEGKPNRLRSFTIGTDGKLNEAPGSPVIPPMLVADTDTLPLGLIEHPTLPIIYTGFVNIARVGVYSLNESSGQLTYVNSASNSGSEICWLTTSPDGKSLYTANMLDTSISYYDLSNPMAPVEKQHIQLPQVNQAGSFELATDPASKFLYVITSRGVATKDQSNPAGNAIDAIPLALDGSMSQTPIVTSLSDLTTKPAYLAAHPTGLVVF